METRPVPTEFLLPMPQSSRHFGLSMYAKSMSSLQYSKLTNAVLAGLFCLSLIVHLWQGKRGGRLLMAMMVTGTAGEMIGHLTRILVTSNGFESSQMLIQLIAFSLAPVSLAGGLFVVLRHRIVVLRSQRSRCIRPSIYTWTFAILVAQTILSPIAAKLSDASNSRLNISGVVSQMAMLIVLLLMFIELQYLAERRRVDQSRWFLIPPAIALIALFIRGTYCTAEIVMRSSHPAIRNELFFVNFDSCMCLIVAVDFNFFYPRPLPSRQSAELTKLRIPEKEHITPA